MTWGLGGGRVFLLRVRGRHAPGHSLTGAAPEKNTHSKKAHNKKQHGFLGGGEAYMHTYSLPPALAHRFRLTEWPKLESFQLYGCLVVLSICNNVCFPIHINL